MKAWVIRSGLLTIALFLTMVFLLAGCAVGPNYKRPDVTAPAVFRSPGPPPANAASDTASLADLPWFEVFKDEQLQALIRTALANNYDLRDAVVRIDAARAVAGITRANQLPNLGVGGSVDINRLSRDGATKIPAAVLPNQDRNFGSEALN